MGCANGCEYSALANVDCVLYVCVYVCVCVRVCVCVSALVCVHVCCVV